MKKAIIIIAVIIIAIAAVLLIVKPFGRRDGADETASHEPDGEMEEVLASGEGVSSEAIMTAEEDGEVSVPEELDLELPEDVYNQLLRGMVYVKGNFSNDELKALDETVSSYAEGNGWDPATAAVEGYDSNVPDEDGRLFSEYSLIFDSDDGHRAYLTIYPGGDDEAMSAEMSDTKKVPSSGTSPAYFAIGSAITEDDFSDMGGDIASDAERHIGTAGGEFNNLTFVVHILNEVGAIKTSPSSCDGLFKICAKTSHGEDAVPGDLIFFSEDGQKIDHVGIYTNPDTMVYMGEEVREVRISEEPYWSEHIYRFGRVYYD